MVLSDLCQVLGEDWEPLLLQLGVGENDIDIIKQEVHTSQERASLWRKNFGDLATGNAIYKLFFQFSCSNPTVFYFSTRNILNKNTAVWDIPIYWDELNLESVSSCLIYYEVTNN
jgi:hypothetical protein